MIMRRSPFRLIAGIGCGTLFVCFVAYICLTVATAGFYEARMHVSSNEANSVLHHDIEIPESAEDVNFATNVWTSRVDVKISEDAFLAWCKRKEWTVQEIADDDPEGRHYFGEDGKETVVLATDGYSFNVGEGDRGFSGVFDREAGRASVLYTSR